MANLTLMALGSSAPEILLSVIEILSGDFFSGALGPSCIVGSAAFNMLGIMAVCMVALPDGEGRKIMEPTVYIVTAVTSIFAYVWLIIILQVTSPDIVTVTEGVLTFSFFPVLVWACYVADRGYCSSRSSSVAPDVASRVTSVSGAGITQADSIALT